MGKIEQKKTKKLRFSHFSDWFIYSYDSGVIASVLVMPEFQNRFGLQTDTVAGSAIVPVSLAASFVASFVNITN